MGDDRPPVYWEDTKLVIRASAIGHPCLWELVAAGQGVDSSGAPAWMKRAFQEGHDAEPQIVAELEQDYGIRFESHQDEGELLILSNILREAQTVVMRYHPDGIGIVDLHRVLPDLFLSASGVRCVVEIKNLSDVLWQKARTHGVQSTIADYQWQLSGMMIKERLPGLWVCKNKGRREKGEKVPCEDEGKLFFQYVHEPLITYPEFVDRAREILDGVMGEDVLTSDRPCDDPTHFPCLYRHVRPEPTEEELMVAKNKDKVVWEVPEHQEEELEDHLKGMLAFKGEMDEAKKRYEAHRDSVVAMLPEGIDVVVTSKRTFNVAPSYSNKVDWDAMSPELRAAVEKYKKSKVTGRHVRDFKRRD